MRVFGAVLRRGEAVFGGRALVDPFLVLLDRGELGDYRLAHAARADLNRQLGRRVAARRAYERALALTKQDAEKRFLERRLAELSGP